ncbi:MAG: hypothetical protein JWR61_3670 [Ferruginibacter sp.]|uniref:sensor histidine kinase n=1 Tax=Ferruginibacter sp. TaxID=1940288 RepID=UPI002657AD00|nr:sensor histidine kinase [Ferruginibacter sp.]MDB5278715.1 hypothetical protein [Ferruginibacter sp.]
MKIAKPSKVKWQAYWFSMVFISFAFTWILYDERIWTDWKVWAVTVPLIHAIGYISFMGHIQYIHWLQQKFPSLELTGKRIFYKLLVNLLVMTPSVLLIFYVFQAFHILGYTIREDDIRYGYLVGLSTNLIFETLFEVIFIIDKYKESIAEKATLEQLQLQQEFDGLKQKVNPHFLFNCFNTLSSLISEDKDKAETFLDELSKVYRYLIRNNEDGMSTLANEMKFIESYFKLLKTRHGDAISLHMEADKKYYPYLLPSLSLQLLVENAVKHNSISKAQPLSIEIFTTEGNRLVVNNNLQHRTVKAPGNKIGLENIKVKYDLLHLPGFQIIENERNFTVVMPLLWNNATSQKIINTKK